MEIDKECLLKMFQRESVVVIQALISHALAMPPKDKTERLLYPERINLHLKHLEEILKMLHNLQSKKMVFI
jgi:hypothetical protein